MSISKIFYGASLMPNFARAMDLLARLGLLPGPPNTQADNCCGKIARLSNLPQLALQRPLASSTSEAADFQSLIGLCRSGAAKE
jgi:hypothetical protein